MTKRFIELNCKCIGNLISNVSKQNDSAHHRVINTDVWGNVLLTGVGVKAAVCKFLHPLQPVRWTALHCNSNIFTHLPSRSPFLTSCTLMERGISACNAAFDEWRVIELTSELLIELKLRLVYTVCNSFKGKKSYSVYCGCCERTFLFIYFFFPFGVACWTGRGRDRPETRGSFLWSLLVEGWKFRMMSFSCKPQNSSVSISGPEKNVNRSLK